MPEQPSRIRRILRTEGDHPFWFNLILIGSIAAIWAIWDPGRAAIFFALALPLRVWFFRRNGPGQRLRARWATGNQPRP